MSFFRKMREKKTRRSEAGGGTSQVGGYWTEHKNIDMCRQGDIEIIHNWRKSHSIDDLKRIVEQKGYTCFTVSSGNPSFNHAALKQFGYQVTAKHCKPISSCCNHPCTIYIYHRDQSTKGAKQTESGTLEIVKAWYGHNSPSMRYQCGHHKGKDVTDIIRSMVSNNELHLNPKRKGQYLNDTFQFGKSWAHCKVVAVKYRYGSGPVHEIVTNAVPNESVGVDITPQTNVSNKVASNSGTKSKWAFFVGKTLESYPNANPKGPVETFKFEMFGKNEYATIGTKSGRNEYNLGGDGYLVHKKHGRSVTAYVNGQGEFQWSHGYRSRVISGQQHDLSALNAQLNSTARNTNDTKKLVQLIKHGADLLSTNGPQWRHTPLHQAAYHNRPVMVEALIIQLREQGLLQQNLSMESNPCGRGKYGYPIELARGGGHHKVVEILEKASVPEKSKEILGSAVCPKCSKTTRGEEINFCSYCGINLKQFAGNAHGSRNQGASTAPPGYTDEGQMNDL